MNKIVKDLLEDLHRRCRRYCGDAEAWIYGDLVDYSGLRRSVSEIDDCADDIMAIELCQDIALDTVIGLISLVSAIDFKMRCAMSIPELQVNINCLRRKCNDWLSADDEGSWTPGSVVHVLDGEPRKIHIHGGKDE